MIQEIIDLNLEILQMEKQKENIVKKMKENPYLKNILPKIDEQINNFREQLLSLEDELISVDFGSSRIYENSIQNWYNKNIIILFYIWNKINNFIKYFFFKI